MPATRSENWTVEQIKHNLQNNDNWVVRAVSAVYKFQTAIEQCNHTTVEDNGVGFNAVDALLLCSFAQQIEKWNNTDPSTRHRFPLSAKQVALARKKILKYAKQLTKIANGEVHA